MAHRFPSSVVLGTYSSKTKFGNGVQVIRKAVFAVVGWDGTNEMGHECGEGAVGTLREEEGPNGEGPLGDWIHIV
jgi:hypothetical protein